MYRITNNSLKYGTFEDKKETCTDGLGRAISTTRLHLELSGCFPLETHHKFPHEAKSKD